MGGQVGAEHQNVIEEKCDKLTQEWPESVVHRRLERRWGITEAKGHYPELVMTLVRTEGRLVYVGVRHSNLMKTLPQIEFRET